MNAHCRVHTQCPTFQLSSPALLSPPDAAEGALEHAEFYHAESGGPGFIEKKAVDLKICSVNTESERTRHHCLSGILCTKRYGIASRAFCEEIKVSQVVHTVFHHYPVAGLEASSTQQCPHLVSLLRREYLLPGRSRG